MGGGGGRRGRGREGRGGADRFQGSSKGLEVEKGVFPSIRERQQRKHQKRNWLVSDRGELGTSPCIFGIRAAPRNYQLDAEIGKKWPGVRFSKVPIINGPGKLSPFTLKIEVSIVLHLTR